MVSLHNLPPPRPDHPRTFLERGPTVPFTTPLLGGARARRGEGQAMELVIPNLAGGSGAYILDWRGLTAFCRATSHDRALCEQVATLGVITPGPVREVARAVAAAGLAGEQAREAALAARASDHAAKLRAQYGLLVALVRQMEPAAPGSLAEAMTPAPLLTAAEVMARARLAILHAAPRVGRSVEWVVEALEQLGETLAPIGLDDGPAGQGTHAAAARMPQLIGLMQRMRTDIVAWSVQQPPDILDGCAEMVSAYGGFTLTLAQTTLHETRALTHNVIHLLQRWATQPDEIRRLVGRLDWLLDGWERICRVWHHAQDDGSRRAALSEMTQLVPVIPAEVMEWSSAASSAGMDAMTVPRLRRQIAINEDWRTGGAVFNLIARNEHFRAVTL